MEGGLLTRLVSLSYGRGVDEGCEADGESEERIEGRAEVEATTR